MKDLLKNELINNLDLQKSCEEAERKHKIQKQYMLDNYGLS